MKVFYCQHHGCKISVSGCVRRQGGDGRAPFKVPVDPHCRSGECKQGQEALALHHKEQPPEARQRQRLGKHSTKAQKDKLFRPTYRDASGQPVGVLPVASGRNRGRYAVYRKLEGRYDQLIYEALPAQKDPEEMAEILKTYGDRQKTWAPIQERTD